MHYTFFVYISVNFVRKGKGSGAGYLKYSYAEVQYFTKYYFCGPKAVFISTGWVYSGNDRVSKYRRTSLP